MSSMLNGIKLYVQEFWDALLLCYTRTPGDLPSRHSEVFGAKFCVRHTLEYKVGGLVMLQHNEINEELCDLVTPRHCPLQLFASKR
jgi:hypothetical protein